MKLTTEIIIPKSKHPISYHSKIMAFGSCFAENMGEKFRYYKFQNLTNPFGILFHPLAIEKIISSALSEKIFTENDIFFHQERWHCFDVHSGVSHENKDVFLNQLNALASETKKTLIEATHCIITLGTAWVYRHKKTNAIVANCHKIPQTEFEKQLLSVNEIANSIANSLQVLKKVNPNISFICTVSPVRHLKDGFVENQQSKAHLIAGLHEFLNKKNSHLQLLKEIEAGTWEYFPSYEIMMDELRDYRFYAADMLHPNAIAIDYIWERFSKTHILEEAYTTMQEVDYIQKALAHKPFHANGEAHLHFLAKLHDRKEALQEKHPSIHF